MTSKVTIRPAIAADVFAYYKGYPPYRMIAFVAELDGEIIGVAGVAYPVKSGPPVLFSDMSPVMAKRKKDIIRSCRIVLKFLDDLGVPIFATAQQELPTAPYMLAKLGFKPTGIMTPVGDQLMREPR